MNNITSLHPSFDSPTDLYALADRRQWVAWRYERRGERETKVPYAPTSGRKAAVDDSSSWGTRAEAERRAAEIGGGVGLILTGGIMGIDLDDCRDAETGAIAPWALQVIRRVGSHAEISPSGRGVKIFFLLDPAELPAIRQAIGNEWGRTFSRGAMKIELHLGHRYYAVTDEVISSAPADVSDLLGTPPAILCPVPLATLLWLVTEHGPAFERGGEKPVDRSRELLRLAGTYVRIGGDFNAFAEAVQHHPEALAHVQAQSPANRERAIRRAWEEAQKGLPDDLHGFALDEAGAIEAFEARFSGEMLFNRDQRRWHRWTGAFWQPVRSALAFDWARNLAVDMAGAPISSAAKALRKVSTASAIEKGAAARPCFDCTSDTFDIDPWLLGTPAGTVDLRTGKLRDADPAERISKVTSVGPEDGPTPTFDAFIHDATGGDEEAIRFLWQWFGMCLTGDVREEKLLFIHGPGGSGKSTLINTIAYAMGDYALNMPAETLTESKFDRHPTEIARLHGARLAWASETEQGRHWSANRIKELTGGDAVTARFMGRDFFTFRPVFKLTVVGNNAPALRNVDSATRRRFLVVPFTHRPSSVDDTLKEKLRAEAPGILAGMISGCLDWQVDGLRIPTAVADATDDYLANQDVLGEWIAECCELHPSFADTTSNLFESWNWYARAQGVEPGNKNRTFPDSMRDRGFIQTRIGKNRVGAWQGLRVRESEESDLL